MSEIALCSERSCHHQPRVSAVLAGAFQWLRRSYAFYHQRRALLALDDAMLKDIGISRVDALREGNKPFWRP